MELELPDAQNYYPDLTFKDKQDGSLFAVDFKTTYYEVTKKKGVEEKKIKGMTPRIPMLSWRQSYHLRTIKKFTKPQHSSRADQLRAAAGTIKRHTIEKLKKDKGYDSDR